MRVLNIGEDSMNGGSSFANMSIPNPSISNVLNGDNMDTENVESGRYTLADAIIYAAKDVGKISVDIENEVLDLIVQLATKNGVFESTSNADMTEESVVENTTRNAAIVPNQITLAEDSKMAEIDSEFEMINQYILQDLQMASKPAMEDSSKVTIQRVGRFL